MGAVAALVKFVVSINTPDSIVLLDNNNQISRLLMSQKKGSPKRTPIYIPDSITSSDISDGQRSPFEYEADQE